MRKKIIHNKPEPAEKKRREQKPKKTENVDHFSRLIHFLNSKDDESLARGAAEFLEFPIENLPGESTEEKTASDILSNPEVLHELKTVRDLLRFAVWLAIHDDPNPEGMGTKGIGLENWLDESAALITRRHNWEKRGFTYWKYDETYDIGDYVGSIPDIIRGRAAVVIGNLFSCGICQRSLGDFFFGICPRCKIVFRKTRGNQLYDRNTCAVETSRGRTAYK